MCIIWQDSIKVNPSILIGSYSIRILQYKPFLWKWSYVVYFWSQKLANSKKQVWSECHIINFSPILPGTIKILWSITYTCLNIYVMVKKKMIKIKECISKGTYHQNKGTSRNKNSQN